MKMSCKDIEKNTVDYFDNKLDAEKLVQFENHLKTCPECHAMVEAQEKWLSQHRYELKSHDNLAEGDLLRLKRSVMDSVRSSQQAERAARYISSYQSSQAAIEQTGQVAQPAGNHKHKIATVWFRPRMIAGYAAMLVLLVLAGFLLKTMIGSNSASRAVLQGDSAVTQAAEMDSLFENEAELPEIDGAAGIENDKNIYGDKNEGESSPENAVENNGVPESATENVWQLFNGKLTDLANISPIFEKRDSTQATTETVSEDPGMETSAEVASVDAVTTVDLLSTAKAIRILTRQSTQDNNLVDVKTADDSVPDTLNNVTEILILAAWSSFEINEQVDNLDSLLESSQSIHTLQLINDKMMYESIEKLIGTEQYACWMRQIEEQDLESFSWISIKIGG